MHPLFIVLCFILVPLQAADQAFTCLGIGGGGRLFEPITNPHDPRVHYVSSDMGPFFVTKDDGEHWTMVEQTQMNMSLSTQPAFHPQHKSWVYLPYHRSKRNEFCLSKDWGITWETLCRQVPWGSGHKKNRTGYYTGPNHIEIDPVQGNLILLSHDKGLYRSDDGGYNFTNCGFDSKRVVSSFISPHTDSDKFYCMAASQDALWESKDGGLSWQKVDARLPKEDIWDFRAVYDPQSKQLNAYVAVGNQVYYSLDAKEYQLCAGLPEAIYARVRLAESHPHIAYVACVNNYKEDGKSTWGVWQTVDKGRTWKKIFRPWKFEQQNIKTSWVHLELSKSWGGASHGLGICNSNPNILSYSNAMEMYMSKDGGKSWDYIASKYNGANPEDPQKSQPWAGCGLEAALPTDIIFDPFKKERCFLTYGDVGMIISNDSGKSWSKASKGIPKKWINRMWALVPDPQNKGVFYSASSNSHGVIMEKGKHNGKTGGVQISYDHGASWSSISNGLPSDQLPVTNMAIDLSSDPKQRTLYCTYPSKGVYKSVDGGKHWQLKSKGLGREHNKNFYGLMVDAKGNVYALSVGLRNKKWRFEFGDGGLWRSTDGAETWHELTAGISLANPVYFNVHPKNSDHILIATTQAPSKESAGLWQTTDGGKHWQQIITRNTFGPEKELYGYIHSGEVCFNPHNVKQIFYSTKTHGLWSSADAGKSWKRRSFIPSLSSGKIVFDPWDNKTMYVCSRGLWKGPIH